MKKLVLLSLLGFMGLVSYRAAAQVSVSMNIGSQPLWGPVGYDHVDYYYLPDVECYYYVPRRQFIYLDNGRWHFSLNLPSRYRDYDLYDGYKVVVNSREPYRNFDDDRVRYARYRDVRTQRVIRYSDDPRYYAVKGHPHGMPPGQAKKYYRGDRWRDDDRGNGKWKDRGEGRGNGKWKDHGNGRGRGREDD